MGFEGGLKGLKGFEGSPGLAEARGRFGVTGRVRGRKKGGGGGLSSQAGAKGVRRRKEKRFRGESCHLEYSDPL